MLSQPIPGNAISTGVAFDKSPSIAYGTVSSATSLSVDVGTTPWTNDCYKGHILLITSGSAAGDARVIVGNDTNTLTVLVPFSATPSAADTFQVRQPTRSIAVVDLLELDTSVSYYIIGTTNRTTGAEKILWDQGSAGARSLNLLVRSDPGSELFFRGAAAVTGQYLIGGYTANSAYDVAIPNG